MEINLIRKTPFKNSIGFFDFYKGILLILIPIYHIFQIGRVIYIEESYSLPTMEVIYKITAIIMPTFFVISGLGFRPSSMKKCMKKQAGLVLLPYFYMALVSVLVVCLKNLIQGRDIFWGVFSHISDFFLVQDASTGWCLWALFWGWILLNLICKIKSEKVRNWVIVVIAVCAMVFIKYPIGIFCVPECLLTCVMLYVGYMIKEKKWFYFPIPIGQRVILGIFSLIFLAFGGANMGESYWKLGIIDFIGSMAMTLLLLKAYTFLILPSNKIVECVMTVGRYGLWVMCLHGIDMLAVNWENIIIKIGLPIWGSVGVHFLLDILFVVSGCKILYELQKIRYREKWKR